MPRFYHRRGFTLTELAVSVAIMALLITIVIANFHRGAQTDALRVSAERLLGNVRLMQTLATTGRTPAPTVGVPPGGYGVAFRWDSITNVTSYYLFADYKEDPGCQTVTPSMVNIGYDPGCTGAGGDLLVEGGTISLSREVRVSKLRVNGTTVGALSSVAGNSGAIYLNISFQPPKPIPLSYNSIGPTVDIELAHRNGDKRTITVIGATGQVQERLGGI